LRLGGEEALRGLVSDRAVTISLFFYVGVVP